METRSPAERGPEVTLELEGPRPQRRWTVALRVILALPHVVYAWFLGIVYLFAVVVGWFAALVLGRMPDGLGTFLARVTQYYGRLVAYSMLLLTDRYPPFALDAPDYPVSVRAPWGGRLNRAAVLFRIILFIPAAIAQQVLFTGLAVCLVFIWLIVLVTTRLPRSLFEAEAAALRYQLRAYAYLAMLTSEYPRGLFGDPGLATDTPAPDISAPAAWEPATSSPAAWEPATSSADEPSFELGDRVPVAAPVAPGAPRINTLVLSKAAKRIVVLFIVLGVVFGIGLNALAVISADNAVQARQDLSDAYGDLSTALNDYSTGVQSCAARQAGIECLQDAAIELQTAFSTFESRLGEISMPAGVLGLADEVDADAEEIIDVLGRMAVTDDPNQYDALVQQLQQVGPEFDADVQALDESLVFSS